MTYNKCSCLTPKFEIVTKIDQNITVVKLQFWQFIFYRLIFLYLSSSEVNGRKIDKDSSNENYAKKSPEAEIGPDDENDRFQARDSAGGPVPKGGQHPRIVLLLALCRVPAERL